MVETSDEEEYYNKGKIFLKECSIYTIKSFDENPDSEIEKKN